MRILIVEDDPMLGEGLQTGLRQAGFQPEWVKDGEAAWQILRHEPFSAVVLDLGLPSWMASRCSSECAAKAKSCRSLY